MLASCAASPAAGATVENKTQGLSPAPSAKNTEDNMNPEPEEETPEVLEYEQEMWNYLMNQYHNPVAAAAIMGNAQGESSLLPYRLSNDIEKGKNGDYPASKGYAERVDNGTITRDAFISAPDPFDSFGLFAWYGGGGERKANLYDFAAERNTSIADWKMQLDFAYKEIVERYPKLYSILMTETDIKTATDAFTQIFERASNDDLYLFDKRTTLAKRFFNKFWGVNQVDLQYEKNEMLPVYQSFDYLDTEVLMPDAKRENIYVYMMQTGLNNLGYQAGKLNGVFGYITEQAVLQFQKDNGLPETGIFTPADWEVLAELNGIKK